MRNLYRDVIYASFTDMNKAIIIQGLLLLFFTSGGVFAQQTRAESNGKFIRHTVAFTLKHAKGSPEEKEFLNEIRKLAEISVVHKFECLRQTSEQNKFDYGVSMEFDTMEAYEEYNQHPDHIAFVETFWVKYVEDFIVIDYEPFE